MRRIDDVGEKDGGEYPVVSDVTRWPVNNSATSQNDSSHGSTKWYRLRPGSSTYFASDM